MKNKLTYIIPGIIFLLALIPVTISVKMDCEVYLKGNLVTVEIVELPNFYTSKYELMLVKLNGKTYTKSINQKKRESLHVGEEIQLRYLPDTPRLLFPEENPTRLAFFEIGFFLLMSAISFYYAFRNRI